MSHRQRKGRGKSFNKFTTFFGNKKNKNEIQPKREYRHQDQLTEEEVGICEYVSNLKGFSGVFKARFSDFQVNEIDLDGKIAKLTDKSIPKDFMKKIERVDYRTAVNSPSEFITQEKWDDIKKLLESEDILEPVTIDAENLSKENRAGIHKVVKSYFGRKIVAGTVTIDNKKVMQFRKFDKECQEDFRMRWPEDKGEYVHFLVYKEALDTMDACLRIANCLGLSPSTFSYAGVKDKRGKTTQWFCVRKVEPWKLITRTHRLQNVQIGNFEFKHDSLKMGQLTGNKFRIAVRNVTVSDDEINESLEQVKKNGFINYYGLQRFGNDKEVPTYSIGVKLLLGEWKEAVNLILKPLISDDPNFFTTKAKQIYAETGDANKALSESLGGRKFTSLEIRLLEGLKKCNTNDYVAALENIPRNTRIFYLHSFQSLIWNKMVTKRIQQYGFKPVKDDLILMEDGSETENNSSDSSMDDSEKDNTVDDLSCKQRIRSLKEEDLPNYTIFDIVLPMPGFDVKYPEHMKEFYKEAIESFGLSLEMPRQKVKCYNLGGAYRNIMCKAKDVSWKVMYYNDPVDNLILSDYEEMLGEAEPKSTEGGKYKALILNMVLPSSSYATMFLREILKSCISSSVQAKLNNYHQKSAEEEKEKKIIVCENANEVVETEERDISQANNSLLADKEKYDEFKNTIFKDILENSEKRKNEEDGENERKKCKDEVKT